MTGQATLTSPTRVYSYFNTEPIIYILIPRKSIYNTRTYGEPSIQIDAPSSVVGELTIDRVASHRRMIHGLFIYVLVCVRSGTAVLATAVGEAGECGTGGVIEGAHMFLTAAHIYDRWATLPWLLIEKRLDVRVVE